MNDMMKTVFSLSLSGSILILVLFLCKPLVKNKISRQWQYYIWLVVIFRLLLPFTPKVSPVGRLFEQVQQTVIQTDFLSDPLEESVFGAEDKSAFQENEENAKEDDFVRNSDIVWNYDKICTFFYKNLWLVWLSVAFILLVRKFTLYQSFIKFIKAGREEIADPSLLNELAEIGAQTGVRRPVELYVNKLVSTPMLFGFTHPCIVLPTIELPDMDFQFTILHELIHCKRWDMLYKWMIQVTICLHWFNPLVYLMGREIERACELSCDEAVIEKLDDKGRRKYGDTLLNAVKVGGRYQSPMVSAMLNAFTFYKGTSRKSKYKSSELLKERLNAIMYFKINSKFVTILSGVLTVMLVVGATTIGAYAGNGSQNEEASVLLAEPEKEKAESSSKKENDAYRPAAEQYYESGDIAYLASAFGQLDEDSQKMMLDELYEDEEIAAFSASVMQLKMDSPLIQYFAEKAYADDLISFFSVLIEYMDETTIESWQVKALQDQKVNFQALLFEVTGKTDEERKLEEEQEAKTLEEYREHGITKEGMRYFYKGQKVKILLDKRSDQSFVLLNMDPEGEVAIRITRNQAGTIECIDYMSEEEIAELFTDEEKEMDSPDVDEKISANSIKKETAISVNARKSADIGIEDGIRRLNQSELPDNVKKVLDNCDAETWYLIRTEKQQYIYYNNPAWEFAYAPLLKEEAGQEAKCQIEVVRMKRSPLKKEVSGYLLLYIPRDITVNVSCDGERVLLTEVEA